MWLVLLAILATAIPITQEGWREILIRSGLNLLVVAYMGAGIVIWTALKHRKVVNPVNRYIGAGDIVFFLALVPLFPIRWFAWLLVASMTFSLLWWKASQLAGRNPGNIPLVATSGIVTGAAIILNTLTQ